MTHINQDIEIHNAEILASLILTENPMHVRDLKDLIGLAGLQVRAHASAIAALLDQDAPVLQLSIGLTLQVRYPGPVSDSDLILSTIIPTDTGLATQTDIRRVGSSLHLDRDLLITPPQHTYEDLCW